MILEVIVTDAAEAELAAQAGAGRVELVTDLQGGGLSPPPGVVRETLARVRIPVRVMLRCRRGGFTYDVSEQEAMLAQASEFVGAGARGLVFGALDSQGRIDRAFLQRLLEAAPGAQITFHRAFDELADPIGGYRELGRVPQVTHVLTSGCARDAWNGRGLLRELIALRESPAVIAAGGIGPRTIGAILAETGATEVHSGSGARIGGRLDPSRIAAMAAQLGSPGGRVRGERG